MAALRFDPAAIAGRQITSARLFLRKSGEDKLRLMSESARGEGGRVWVPKQKGDQRSANSIPESDRWYFLEEWYPKYGNLVPKISQFQFASG